MTTETKTTDFDTVKGALKSVGLYDNHPDFHKNIDKGIEAAVRIEASHSALVSALEELLSRYTGGDAKSGAIYVTKEIIETAQSALKTP